MMEIIRELTAIKETKKITSDQVQCWAKRVDAQRMHKALLEETEEIKESKELDAIKKVTKPNLSTQNAKKKKKKKQRKAPKQIYGGTLHETKRCQAYGKSCAVCGRADHFELVCKSASRRLMKHVVSEKLINVHDMHQDSEEIEMSSQEFDMLRSKMQFPQHLISYNY